MAGQARHAAPAHHAQLLTPRSSVSKVQRRYRPPPCSPCPPSSSESLCSALGNLGLCHRATTLRPGLTRKLRRPGVAGRPATSRRRSGASAANLGRCGAAFRRALTEHSSATDPRSPTDGESQTHAAWRTRSSGRRTSASDSADACEAPAETCDETL